MKKTAIAFGLRLIIKLTSVRMLLASVDKYLGSTGFSLHIDQKSSSSSHPLKGDCPNNIS